MNSHKFVEKIQIIREPFQLKKPYSLSFGPVSSFDTIFSKITLDSGETGIGEAVPLPGYGWETAGEAFLFLKYLSSVWEGKPVKELYQFLANNLAKHPFAITSILTALEMAADGWKQIDTPFEVPLVTLLETDNNKEIHKIVAQFQAQGVSTFKVKLGSKPIIDELLMIKLLKTIDWKNCRLRFDANQAFSYVEALRIGQTLEGLPVEYFEQPLHRDSWKEMEELTKNLVVPTMLDESIWSIADVDRTIQNRTAHAVKLKLMKCGSLKNAEQIINFAKKGGIDVVFGNGVAGFLACHQEAILHKHLNLTSAGEMNGLFKLLDFSSSSKLQKTPTGLRVKDCHPPGL